MAILSVQSPDSLTAPDGTRVSVTPREWLLMMGARTEVTISLTSRAVRLLIAQGQSPPSPVSGLALIDTGASTTCVDEGVAQRLQLPVVDVATTATPTDPAAPRNVYPINIQIPGMGINVDASRAIGVELSGQGLLLLIGRNFLSRGIFIFNGFSGQWSFSL